MSNDSAHGFFGGSSVPDDEPVGPSAFGAAGDLDFSVTADADDAVADGSPAAPTAPAAPPRPAEPAPATELPAPPPSDPLAARPAPAVSISQPPTAAGPPPPGAEVMSAPMTRRSPAAAAAAAAPAAGRRIPRAVVIGAAAALALAAAGAAAWAYGALSGGGPQPEQHVPASAFAFVKVDLDPSASQKIAALRFMSRFPDIDTADGADLKETVLRSLVGADSQTGLDYDTDIEPWVGDRVALAAVPVPGAEPGPAAVSPLAVIQLSDGARDDAKKSLDKALAVQAGSEDGVAFGYAFADGYVLLSDTHDSAARHARSAADRSLADDGTQFSRDADGLDDDRVALAWVDAGRAAEIAGPGAVGALAGPYTPAGPASATGQPVTGRIAAAARFDDDAFEVVGKVSGGPAPVVGSRPGTLVAALPEGTVAAFGTTGLDKAVTDGWQQFVDSPAGDLLGLSGIAADTGLDLPGDLAALLGSQTAVAFGGMGGPDDGAGAVPGEDVLRIALRTVTDDKPAALAAAAKVQALADDSGFPIGRAETDSGLVWASSQAYADEVAADGSLGRSEAFRAAAPDADGAGTVLYVDAAALVDQFLPDDADDLPFGSFGMTATSSGADQAFRARLTLR